MRAPFEALSPRALNAALKVIVVRRVGPLPIVTAFVGRAGCWLHLEVLSGNNFELLGVGPDIVVVRPNWNNSKWFDISILGYCDENSDTLQLQIDFVDFHLCRYVGMVSVSPGWHDGLGSVGGPHRLQGGTCVQHL